MGRPRTFDEERALEAAMEQFWRDGYNGSSLQALLKATRLSKSSLYQTFGSKQDLFVRSFDQYKRNMVNNLLESLSQSPTPRQFIEDFLLCIIEEANTNNQQRKGCLIVNSAHELSQKDPVLASAVSEGSNKIAAVFKEAIQQGKASGDITTKSSADDLTSYLMTNICGLRTMVMAGADRETLVPVARLIMNVIK